MGRRFRSVLVIVGLAVVIIAVWAGLRYADRPAVVEDQPSDPPHRSEQDANIITLHYHERKPYYMTGANEVFGVCATPAKIAFEKAGVPVRWQKTPARRQLEIIKRNSGRDCLLGWFKNPEREQYARFSLPIYQDRPAIVLARADNEKITSDMTIEALLSRSDITLLKKDAYSYGEFVDRKIAEYDPGQVVTTAENLNMLKMIRAGRADYFFIAQEEAEWLIGASSLPEADFKFVTISDIPKGNKRYLLFSYQVEPEIVDKVNQAIRLQLNYVEEDPLANEP